MYACVCIHCIRDKSRFITYSICIRNVSPPSPPPPSLHPPPGEIRFVIYSQLVYNCFEYSIGRTSPRQSRPSKKSKRRVSAATVSILFIRPVCHYRRLVSRAHASRKIGFGPAVTLIVRRRSDVCSRRTRLRNIHRDILSTPRELFISPDVYNNVPNLGVRS